MPGHVASNLAAARRVADMDGVLQVEMPHQGRHVGGVGVYLVAGGGLGRAVMAATVMRHDAVTLSQEEHHLGIPVVRGERPSVVEDDRLPVPRSL